MHTRPTQNRRAFHSSLYGGFETYNVSSNPFENDPYYYQEGIHTESPAYIPELIDRFNLLKQRIERINQQIQIRDELTQKLLRQIQEQLINFRFQLEEHLNTWRSVGINPSADSRRTFLEGQVSRLEERLYLVEIERFNTLRELERELFNLLQDYLQLKRAIQSL